MTGDLDEILSRADPNKLTPVGQLCSDIEHLVRECDLSRKEIAMLRVEHARLSAEAAAMAAYLRRLEWSQIDGKYMATCPDCDGYQPQHKDGCVLQALIDGQAGRELVEWAKEVAKSIAVWGHAMKDDPPPPAWLLEQDDGHNPGVAGSA